MLRSTHGSVPTSMFVSSRTFEQKQQIGTKLSMAHSLTPWARFSMNAHMRALTRPESCEPVDEVSFLVDESLVPCTNAILNDHQVDNLATGDTAPPTNMAMPAATRLNMKIHRTHEAIATMTTHLCTYSRHNGPRALMRHALSCPSIARSFLSAERGRLYRSHTQFRLEHLTDLREFNRLH